MIPQKTVAEILDATRIEEVIEDFVALRRRGVNLIGLCPFHHEKSPSFNVNPTRNIFKCFGCGKAGDAVTFLREHETMTYPEALRWLARKYNITIEEVQRTPEQIAEAQLTDSLYIVNDFAQKTYETEMFDTDEGRNVALAYFKKRGLSDETIRKFGLGYAPDRRDFLLKKAAAESHSLDLMKKVGLCSTGGDRDFFRARVIFPIHNLSGKVAAFAGRTMSTDKTIPKYINSPETEIYIKNKTLFGLYQAKTAIRRADECILTEGYMDVISLVQAGVENAVASSGTSLTEGQLQLIKRNTQNLKILYDGDPAGIKAALRGLDLALEQDLDVKIVLLPTGEDPDSFVQKNGAEAFQKYASEQAKDFIVFKAELLLGETKGDPMKKAAVVKDIVASVAKIPDPIKRNIYLKECAALVDVAEQALLSEVNKLISKELKKKQEREARAGGAASDSPGSAGDPGFPTEEPSFYEPEIRQKQEEKRNLSTDEAQERDIIRLLIHHGGKLLESEKMTVGEFILADIEESLGSFENPLFGKIAQECYDLLVNGKSFDTDYFVSHPNSQVSQLAADLLTEPWEMSPLWEERYHLPLQNQPAPELNFVLDARQGLDRFKLRKMMKICQINLERIKAASQSNDFEEMMRLMKIQKKIEETRNDLARRTGTVILK